MPPEDIYRNGDKYRKFIATLDRLTTPPKERGRRKYYCRNPANLAHFKSLDRLYERKDTSYIRRLRLARSLLVAAHVTDKEFSTCTRADIDQIVTFSHTVNQAPKSKAYFIADLKYLWRVLFPERDHLGRVDDITVPYVVRHLSPRIDRSRDRMREDRLSWEEYERLVTYFSGKQDLQCYLTLAVESLGRPQELLYRKLRDIDWHESYARIWVSDHGKEGNKALQCIDSFPYLTKWISQHPYGSDPEAYLFPSPLRYGRTPRTPASIAKHLRQACQALGIDKRITAYSLKRNGITFSRLRGDADIDIQHRAGWTSTKQLHTYDLSTQDDTLHRELAKRGIASPAQRETYRLHPGTCPCGSPTGFTDQTCSLCNRPTGPTANQAQATEEELRRLLEIALQHPDRTFGELFTQAFGDSRLRAAKRIPGPQQRHARAAVLIPAPSSYPSGEPMPGAPRSAGDDVANADA